MARGGNFGLLYSFLKTQANAQGLIFTPSIQLATAYGMPILLFNVILQRLASRKWISITTTGNDQVIQILTPPPPPFPPQRLLHRHHATPW